MPVVYRTIPTSNHNRSLNAPVFPELYIVLFLHQTTTITEHGLVGDGCISYYSYIKPQPHETSNSSSMRCISYYSYIKPQLLRTPPHLYLVVYRTIPTSNHNASFTPFVFPSLYIVLFLHQTTTLRGFYTSQVKLYIVLFLHQTTTFRLCGSILSSCISYYSYIKPQLMICFQVLLLVVYRTIPTSNHNSFC